MKNPITLKALVFLDDASGSNFQMDCIMHVGKSWLVPIWLESLSKEHETPARLILLDNLPHQDNGPNSPFGRYTLQIGIPKVLLTSGQLPPLPPFVVLDLPDGGRLPTFGK